MNGTVINAYLLPEVVKGKIQSGMGKAINWGEGLLPWTGQHDTKEIQDNLRQKQLEREQQGKVK